MQLCNTVKQWLNNENKKHFFLQMERERYTITFFTLHKKMHCPTKEYITCNIRIGAWCHFINSHLMILVIFSYKKTANKGSWIFLGKVPQLLTINLLTNCVILTLLNCSDNADADASSSCKANKQNQQKKTKNTSLT